MFQVHEVKCGVFTIKRYKLRTFLQIDGLLCDGDDRDRCAFGNRSLAGGPAYFGKLGKRIRLLLCAVCVAHTGIE